MLPISLFRSEPRMSPKERYDLAQTCDAREHVEPSVETQDLVDSILFHHRQMYCIPCRQLPISAKQHSLLVRPPGGSTASTRSTIPNSLWRVPLDMRSPSSRNKSLRDQTPPAACAGSVSCARQQSMLLQKPLQMVSHPAMLAVSGHTRGGFMLL